MEITTVFVVTNIAHEHGGIYSTREKAEERVKYLETEYGEKWFILERRVF